MNGFDFGWNPMTALTGLSVLGDVGGAISNYFQQQRQRDIYKKAMDPASVATAAQAYAQPIYQQMSPQIARQAAASLGQSGVSQGGYGNALMQQALAQYLAQLQQQGAQNYLGQLNAAQGAIGPSFGSSGASKDALMYLMMLNAKKNQDVPGQTPGQTPGIAGSPSGSISTMTPPEFMPGVNPATAGQDMANLWGF